MPDPRGLVICPICAKKLDMDEMAWVWQMKFYCSETCVRKANGRP